MVGRRINKKGLYFKAFSMFLDGVESELSGHAVRKLEPIQFPYFGMG